MIDAIRAIQKRPVKVDKTLYVSDYPIEDKRKALNMYFDGANKKSCFVAAKVSPAILDRWLIESQKGLIDVKFRERKKKITKRSHGYETHIKSILSFRAAGLSSEQIGGKIGMTKATVNNYLKRFRNERV